MTSVLTLTPACSVQLYWMSLDMSLTPSEREMDLYRRDLGSGNSFKSSTEGLKQKVRHTERRNLSSTFTLGKLNRKTQNTCRMGVCRRCLRVSLRGNAGGAISC